MKKHCSHNLSIPSSWLALLANAAVLSTSVVAAAQQAQPPADPRAASITIPGVPNQPDLVTVVPFYHKENETAAERTKVIIPARVDNVFGLFVVDLGAPRLNMNRTFLQPSPSGGVDTITHVNWIREGDGEDAVHVTMHIGTLSVVPVDPTVPANDPHHFNAFLNHMWGNFALVFAPRLGNIGLSVLEPFETIVDYTHKRVILIRLDSAGHRLVKVPAYTPKWTAPLIDKPASGTRRWWAIKVRSDYTLDTLNAANNTSPVVLDTGAPENEDVLGYPFLSQFGVVGFNHRTHQFILYR